MAENDYRDYSSNIELVLQPIQYNSLMLKVFFNRIKAEILVCLWKGEELVQNAPYSYQPWPINSSLSCFCTLSFA